MRYWIFVWLFLLSACGGSGSDSASPEPTIPTTPPTVNFVVTIDAGAGGTTSSQTLTVDQNETASFTITPDTNFVIEGVTGCGGVLSGNIFTTQAITSVCTVSVTFVEQFTVAFPATEGLTVIPASQLVNKGDSASFTLILDNGFTIDSVSGCDGVQNGDIYNTGLITGSCSITGTTSRTTQVGAVIPLTTTNNQAVDPKIAVLPNGDAIAIWRDYNGIAFDLHSSVFTTSAGWGAPVTIDTGVETVTNISLIVDNQGNAFAAWAQNGLFAGQNNLLISRYTDANGWDTPVSISSGDVNVSASEFPVGEIKLDTNNTGNAVAVWIQKDASNSGIVDNLYIAEFSESNGWAVAQRIDNDGSNDKDPQVNIDDSGNIVVVWTVQDNIVSVSRNDNTTWGQIELLDNREADARNPVIAADVNGNIIAVWAQGNTNSFSPQTFANYYTQGQGWGNQTLVYDGDGVSKDHKVVMRNDNKATLVWSQNNAILTSVFANNDGWSDASTIVAQGILMSNLMLQPIDTNTLAIIWTGFEDVTTGEESLYSTYTDNFEDWKTPTILDELDDDVSLPYFSGNGEAVAMAIWQQTSNLDNIVLRSIRFE